MRESADHTRALAYLSGEMTPLEEEQYALRLAEDAGERAQYLETAQLWLALTPVEEQIAARPGVRPVAISPKRNITVSYRAWLPRLVALLMVFGFGLLLGRSTMDSPEQADSRSSAVDPENVMDGETEAVDSEETRLAVAWFDLQEDQPSDPLFASLLEDFEQADHSEGNPWETPAELSAEQVPDWLLVALELTRENPADHSGNDSPFLDPAAGESL